MSCMILVCALLFSACNSTTQIGELIHCEVVEIVLYEVLVAPEDMSLKQELSKETTTFETATKQNMWFHTYGQKIYTLNSDKIMQIVKTISSVKCKEDNKSVLETYINATQFNLILSDGASITILRDKLSLRLKGDDKEYIYQLEQFDDFDWCVATILENSEVEEIIH